MKKWKLLFSSLMLLVCTSSVKAFVSESYDTTNSEGYGYDSLFRIVAGIDTIRDYWDSSITYKGDTTLSFNCQVVAYYAFDPGYCRGYFNLSFDDITIAPDTILGKGDNPFGRYDYRRSFVLKDTVKNIYSKLQILKNLRGNRFIYRFSISNIPGSRLFFNYNADSANSRTYRAKLSKVNNVYFTGIRYQYDLGPDSIHTDRLSWDPPALNNIFPFNPSYSKYILYISKENVQIDTTKPINLSQWTAISVPFSSPQSVGQFPRWGYVNMVSVNNRDTSGFLTGWTHCAYSVVNIKESNLSQQKKQIGMTVTNATGKTIVTLSGGYNNSEHGVLSIFNLSGSKIASLPFTGKTVSINREQIDICKGGYILKAAFPGREPITARFLQTH